MNEVPTLVTSCINCITPGSLGATLAMIMIGVGVALTAEQRHKRSLNKRKEDRSKAGLFAFSIGKVGIRRPVLALSSDNEP